MEFQCFLGGLWGFVKSLENPRESHSSNEIAWFGEQLEVIKLNNVTNENYFVVFGIEVETNIEQGVAFWQAKEFLHEERIHIFAAARGTVAIQELTEMRDRGDKPRNPLLLVDAKVDIVPASLQAQPQVIDATED